MEYCVCKGVFENERCCVYSMCSQRVDIWGIDFGDESKGISVAASHRKENSENDLRSDDEGQSGEYSDCIESGSG